MGDTEKCNTDMIQRLHSSFGTSSSSIPKIPIQQQQQHQHQLDLNPNFIRSAPQFPQFSKPFSDSGKRIGVPPSHPNLIPPTSPFSQIPTTRQPGSQNFNPGASHSRSMSQPNSFFSFDSLPPLSPSPFRDSLSAQPDHDVSMEDRDSGGFNSNVSLPPSPFTRCNSTSSSSVRVGESLPPRKSHRRSNSDIPSGFNSMIVQNSLPLIPPRPLERSISGGECADWSKSNPFVKKESSCEREGVGEREAMDDLFSAYMNLENIDVLNSSEADDSKNGNENRDDMESSRASGTKTNGSDTEGETSSVNESANNNNILNSSGEKRESVKRRAGGGDIAPTSRHYRSVSVDSCFMEKLSFGDESLKPPPSPGTMSRKVSPTNSVDGNSGAAFSIEFKNGEFTAAEMKKIMANDKLAEMAMSDPKRVKRYIEYCDYDITGFNRKF